VSEIEFPVKVTLTRVERMNAQLIGTLRRRENRAVGIVDRRVEGKDLSRDIDKQGVAAEFAFARTANVYPDHNTDPRAGGSDCTLPSGVTVDVKSTTRPDGNLIAPAYKSGSPHNGDIIVLVTGLLPLTPEGKDDPSRPAEFTLVGWVWRDELIRPSRLRPLKNGKPTYFLDRHQLRTCLPLLKRPPEPSNELPEEDLDDALEDAFTAPPAPDPPAAPSLPPRKKGRRKHKPVDWNYLFGDS